MMVEGRANAADNFSSLVGVKRTMQATATHPPLEYAPGAPVRRRKRVRRVAQLFVLLCLALAAWRWGLAGWERAKLLYWQRQCMTFTFPPDVVLYEKDPTKAAGLLRQQDPEYVPLPYYGHNQPMVTHAVYQPRCLREFATRSAAAGAKGLTLAQRSIVFCHERHTPAGKRRLVVVYTEPWSDFGPLWEWEVYEPAGPFAGPKLLNAGADPSPYLAGRSGYGGFYVPIRLGPGQADPTDLTHFIVPSGIQGQRPTASYDGRLTDEDKVVMTRRGGPGKP